METASPAPLDKEANTPARLAPTRKSKARRRKIPGIVKLLIVFVVLAGIGGGIYLWSTNANASSAQQSTVTLPVTQGDLNVTVQSNGTVAATREQAVTYQTTGNVVEVLVKSGDTVQAGQPLVRQTDADQKAAVAQAQAALNTAQAKLDDLKKGPSEADVTNAQAAVNAAQADLDSVKAGATKKDIADAQADLRSAEANLATVKAGATPKEIADAQADLKEAQTAYDTIKAGATKQDIANAEADLNEAQAKYDALVAPPTASTLKEAQSKLASAQAKLKSLKSGPSATDLSAAQLAVTQAQTSLKTTQNNAALDKQKKQLAMEKADRDLAQAQRDYAAIAGQVLDANGNFAYDPNARDYSTKYNDYWTAYNALKDAQAAQTQAYDDLQNSLANEVQDITAAQAKLDDANKNLAEVQAGPTDDEIASAQADVDTAQKALDDLTAGPTKDDLATAQTAVTKAQTALDQLKAGPAADDLAKAETAVVKAQTTLDQLKAGPTADTLAAAQTTVDKARDKLNDLLAGPTKSDITAAEATVATKQAVLQALYQTATASEIAAAEETVTGAQKDLDDANAELDKTVLKAPFSGVIAEVAAEPNSEIKVGDTAITIYDQSGMHVELAVNESDIQKIKAGEEGTITLDALPGKVFTGTVSTVSNVSQTNQDVVTYQVDVQFDPASEPVKTGMTANATITVESHANVIQVPTRAIKTQGRNKTVEVLYGENQTPITIAVTTGASNSQMTEITGCIETGNQCLRAGDKVAVTITATTTNSAQQFPGGVGIFQGGAFPGERQGTFRQGTARP